MPLETYRQKRNPERTPEPFGARPVSGGRQNGGVFVIQKHDATRLHYDLRLEMEGVLRSWAVPKGPSLNPADKHLAVMVEDHPLEYGDFEGVIPEGNYGAGAVIVWDRGVYSAIDPKEDVAEAVRKGKLDLSFRGYKLRGVYTLVRTGGAKAAADGKQQWLLIKKRDEYAREEDITAAHPRSVLSGLGVEEMYEASAEGDAIATELTRARLPKIAALDPKEFPLMLATVHDEPVDGDQWLFELKYDGVRALAIREGESLRLFARSGTDITGQYPEVALALRALPYKRFVIDGEIVALNDEGRPDFQLLQRRMHLQDRRDIARMSLAVPVCHFAFDLLAFDRFDLRGLALEKRKNLLQRLLKGEGPLRYCEHIIGRGHDFFDAVKENGLEGMVAKLRASPYRGRRSTDWLKIKAPRALCFVIGGYTDPSGSRTHFGALLLGQYESDGSLRFIDKVGTGFNYEKLKHIHGLMRQRERTTSPFRRPKAGEPSIPARAHFCEPELVCYVRFSEYTNQGGIRHPSFLKLVEDDNPPKCLYEGPQNGNGAVAAGASILAEPGGAIRQAAAPAANGAIPSARVSVTNPEKVFWPAEGYTKGDLVEYYQAIARWMLPYLKDRPVMLTRYPDGIGGKSFYQKDAPGFAPQWLRTEKIYSHDSERDIAYFVLESADALAYMANLAAITIHMWSSRLPHLEAPDWLLFDIDPKGTTTRNAIRVAQETGTALREIGLRPCIKTSGQAGLHVVVGLEPKYTYEQAKMFSELVARLVVNRIPEIATINRNPRSRAGKVYIDYLQLGHGKTIAAPFSVRPIPGAPVSAPLQWQELTPDLDPGVFNIKTMPQRMERMRHDPFIGAIEDKMTLEQALPNLEAALQSLRARP
jgi:bifunctional non-homologous end joining protein LigD